MCLRYQMTAIYLGMPKRSTANQMARKPLDILRYPTGGRWSKLKWDMRCGNRQLFNFLSAELFSGELRQGWGEREARDTLDRGRPCVAPHAPFVLYSCEKRKK